MDGELGLSLIGSIPFGTSLSIYDTGGDRFPSGGVGGADAVDIGGILNVVGIALLICYLEVDQEVAPTVSFQSLVVVLLPLKFMILCFVADSYSC